MSENEMELMALFISSWFCFVIGLWTGWTTRGNAERERKSTAQE